MRVLVLVMGVSACVADPNAVGNPSALQIGRYGMPYGGRMAAVGARSVQEFREHYWQRGSNGSEGARTRMESGRSPGHRFNGLALAILYITVTKRRVTRLRF